MTGVHKAGAISKIDNHLLRVADLDAAISFYGDKLGHRLLWRNGEAAGFVLPETDAELVVHQHIGPETDILVSNVDEAFAAILLAGGVAIQPPFTPSGVAALSLWSIQTRRVRNGPEQSSLRPEPSRSQPELGSARPRSGRRDGANLRIFGSSYHRNARKQSERGVPSNVIVSVAGDPPAP